MPFKLTDLTVERLERIALANLETRRRNRANNFLRAIGLPTGCGVDPHEWYARRREELAPDSLARRLKRR